MSPEDPDPTSDLPRPQVDDQSPDPVAPFREPDNQIKLLLVIAALAALNLILVAWALAEIRDEHEIVEVEGQRCILVHEEDAAALYCRR